MPKLVYDTLIFLGPISNVKIINFVPSKTNAEITLAITFEQASAAREALSHRTFEIPPLLCYQKTCLTFCCTRPGTRNRIRPLSRTHPPRSRTSYLWKPSHLQKPNLALYQTREKQPSLLATLILAPQATGRQFSKLCTMKL
jgi:hypothetical protein